MKIYDQFYIDGAWRKPAGTGTIDVIDSGTEAVIGRIPEGVASDAQDAIRAARAAFDAWAATPAATRAGYLRKIVERLQARSEELAQSITGEVGMPIKLSRAIQVGGPIYNWKAYAKLAESFEFEAQVGNSLVVREPVGVVAAITPWNYPLNQITLKVAPAHAGGHLGVTQIDDMHDARFDFARVLDETAQVMASLGIARDTIPLIVAGGINSHDTVRAAFEAGANGVQVGTPFAVTEEGDAHPHFKRVLADATPDDIVEFVSVTGLPARAVKTPWLDRYLRNETRIRNKLGAFKQRCPTALECLSVCGLRDGIEKFGHFCIDTRLAAALRGDVANGLFFRGREALPFGRAIRSVRDLLDLLLTGSATEPAANRPTFTLA